jgi:hypothetical protein
MMIAPVKKKRMNGQDFFFHRKGAKDAKKNNTEL